MNKFSQLALIGLSAAVAAPGFGAGWTSAGSGTAYSLTALSQTEGAGLSKVSDNVFLLSNDITISEGDSFTLEGGVTLRIAGSSQIRIEGDCALGNASGRTLITRNDTTDTPKGIYIVRDAGSPAQICNLDFEYASLRNYGTVGFNMNNCSFRLSNGKLSSAGALTLGKTGASFTISQCTFSENTVPAIGSGANIYCGVTISDCSIFDCTTQNSNKPMINISVGGDSAVIIRNVNITGTGRNMVGGISMNNMLSGKGKNVVTIDSVTVRNCRYGINAIGPQKLTVSRALLLDNHFETNPMNGGSGISLSSVKDTAIISGCRIENSLWGVTLIKSPANLGQVDNAASPGNNVFVNNGNNGGTEGAAWKPYDLYNNSTYTIYAQNNTWSVPEQTQTEIEKVISHKNDDASLGEVIFMPAKAPLKVNTLASLSQTAESGVTKVSEGVYLLSKDVTIPETETFTLEGGVTLRIKGSSQIKVNGPCTLGRADARTLITRNDSTDTPKGIYITYNGTESIFIRNLDFEYAQIRNFGNRGFDMDNCSFKYANGKLNSSGAISIGKTGAMFRITNCTFSQNTVPAVGGAANMYCGLEMSNCSLYDNNTKNANKPQLNLTVGDNMPVILRNINITGTGRTKVGAIAISNLMGATGANKVIIDSLDIRGHRYGIAAMGALALTVKNCYLYDNSYDPDPMKGGEGISLSSLGDNEAIITGCHIEKHLWGVTVIKSKANLGQVGNWTSPGNNVFVNNGQTKDGSFVPYDLYNNSTNTIYAQNNTWSVPEQTEAEIEKVIFHKNDNSELGLVIFMPAHDPSGVNEVIADKPLIIDNGMIICNNGATEVVFYTTDGRIAARLPLIDGMATLPSLSNGIYIMRAGNAVLKIKL